MYSRWLRTIVCRIVGHSIDYTLAHGWYICDRCEVRFDEEPRTDARLHYFVYRYRETWTKTAKLLLFSKPCDHCGKPVPRPKALRGDWTCSEQCQRDWMPF